MGPEGRLMMGLPIMAAGPARDCWKGAEQLARSSDRGPLCTHDSRCWEADREISLEA